MRLRYVILGLSIIGLLTFAKAGCNETQCEDQGIIIYGTGLGDTVPVGSEFIDGKKIDIRKHNGTGASTEPVWLWYNATDGGNAAMGVRFYEDDGLTTLALYPDGTLANEKCTYSSGFNYANPQHCDAPPEAAWAYVGLVPGSGALVEWHFLYVWD